MTDLNAPFLRAPHDATLRDRLLKEKDSANRFGDLVRVQNKRREFLWVHPQFAKEY